MRTAILGILVLSLAFTLAPPADAGVSARTVRGTMTAPQTGSTASGRFVMAAVTSGTRGGEKLLIIAKGLTTTSKYSVVLKDSAGVAYTFATGMTLRGSRGVGTFRFSSKRDAYPADSAGTAATTLTAFGGGTLSVMTTDAAGNAVTALKASIPTFTTPNSGTTPPAGSMAFGAGAARLQPPASATTRAYGRLLAFAVNSNRGARERLTIVALGLTSTSAYTVNLVDTTVTPAVTTTLGTFTTRGYFGVGFFVLDTKKGATLPAAYANLSKMAGLTVNVDDAAKTTVLTGTFPTLK